MNGVENWGECSELHQDPGKQKQDKAGDRGKRRFALIALRTSCFDCGFHDRTGDLTLPNCELLLRLMCRQVHRNSRWKAHEFYKCEIKNRKSGRDLLIKCESCKRAAAPPGFYNGTVLFLFRLYIFAVRSISLLYGVYLHVLKA